jgi:rhomboid protease GluP
MEAPPIPNEAPPTALARKPIPYCTLLACAACIAVFLGLNLEADPESWDAYSKWGYLPTDRIRAGAYWALFSSVFVHAALWHVAFNVYWLFTLGRLIERAIGWHRWLTLFVISSIISSGWQLAVSDTTGIGASGVVYALFGFMVVARRKFPEFTVQLNQKTIVWFIAWLVGCIVMTRAGVWTVGNAAHVAGLVSGMIFGAYLIWPRRRAVGLGLALLTVASIIPLFWAPWSADWISTRGYQAHARGDYAEAIKWYQRAIQAGQQRAWCLENMGLAYYELGDIKHCAEVVVELRGLDPAAAERLQKVVAHPGDATSR